jgi:hypothetical protein
MSKLLKSPVKCTKWNLQIFFKQFSLNSLQRVAPFSSFSSGHRDDDVGGVVVHVGVVILKSKFNKRLVV